MDSMDTPVWPVIERPNKRPGCLGADIGMAAAFGLSIRKPVGAA